MFCKPVNAQCYFACNGGFIMSACEDIHGRISFRKYPVELLGRSSQYACFFLSSTPHPRPAEDPLLARDTGGILGEPCGVSDMTALLQTQGLGAPDSAGGRPVGP